MTTDSLGRRLQWGARSPHVERFEFTDADCAIFEAIQGHGPLPSHYLYEFTKHLRRDASHLKNRLTELYHGSRQQGHFLDRPQQQYAQFNAHARHVVYDLAPNAKRLLAERGRLAAYSPGHADPFVHQLMSACVAASIELSAPAKGLRYIARDEILARCPAAALAAANPMAIPLSLVGRTLIPDDLFGLEYPGTGFRFFAVEIDRNNESIQRRNPDQTAFGRKIAGYLDILRRQSYRSWWGVPNLSILTVTTNRSHARNLLDYVGRQDNPNHAMRIGFAAEPLFGSNWRVPPGLLSDLLDKPWDTTAGPKDISKP